MAKIPKPACDYWSSIQQGVLQACCAQAWLAALQRWVGCSWPPEFLLRMVLFRRPGRRGSHATRQGQEEHLLFNPEAQT